MRVFFLVLVATLATRIDLFAAEAGMPQLDPKYWASQAFWLILVFSILPNSVSFIKNNFKSNEVVLNSSKQSFNEISLHLAWI